MASPYTKKLRGDEVVIEDADGTVIATLETSTLANYVMASLLGEYPKPPDYRDDVPYSVAGDNDEPKTKWRCRNCYHVGDSNDFSSSNAACRPRCPKCGSAKEVFPDD